MMTLFSCWSQVSFLAVLLLAATFFTEKVAALSQMQPDAASTNTKTNMNSVTRRTAFRWFGSAGTAATTAAVATVTATTTTSTIITTSTPLPAWAVADKPDRFEEEEFLRRGVATQPMGISGQAGKPRPETGVVLRDGSQVSQDPRTGDVAAELLLLSSSSSSGSRELVPILTSYTSPWPLATGSVFDVECRDPRSGDGAFVAVTGKLPSSTSSSIAELPDSFLTNNLFAQQGRFSFYGAPTDVKILSSSVMKDNRNYKQIDVSFATLSQSTQTEIPRKARIVATIPPGTQQAIMLVGSASASRWKKSLDKINQAVGSFRAIPAPKSSLKVRAASKERSKVEL